MAGWLAADQAYIAVPFVTMILGIIIGYLAQRSGFCSIGGIRDLILFKHTRLFFGYIALIASAFVGYLIFSTIIPSAFSGYFWATGKAGTTGVLTPIGGAPAGLENVSYAVLAIIGGFGMGLVGVLLGGCPLRQTIMSVEGNLKSVFFVAGMAIGAIIFTVWVSPWVVSLLP